MRYPEPFDRVQADITAHEEAEERKPWHVCTRCQAQCWTEDASAENWLDCELADCDRVLCWECICEIVTADIVGPSIVRLDSRFTNLESVHELGYCSPGCLAKAFKACQKVSAERSKYIIERNWERR
jgi:hypothetical protein